MNYLIQKKIPRLALQAIDQLLLPLKSEAKISSVGKILFCNIAHLGDAVIATSILPVIRQAFPEAKIGFLSSCSSSCVLEGHPDITWHHKMEHWKINRQPAPFFEKLRTYYQTKWTALEEIRGVGYDLAIDLYPYFPNAIPLLWQADIPVRIGYTSGGFGPLLTHPLLWEKKPQCVPLYHFDLLRILPATLDQTALKYTLPHPSSNCEKWSLKEDFLVFHMGSSSSAKDWPEEYWRALAQMIADRQIVFTGRGKTESERVGRVMSGLPQAVDLSNRLDWKELCTVVAAASQVVAVDSVVAHLAEAYSIPSIMIFMGSSDPLQWKPPHATGLFHPMPEQVFRAFLDE